MRSLSLLLLVLLAACGGAAPSARVAESAPTAVIEGLDGEVLIETLEEGGGPGSLECDGPEPSSDGQEWRCVVGRDYTWKVIILAESLSAIHSIDASVGTAGGTRAPDPGRASSFLAWVAESAVFAGADPAAAGTWVRASESMESAQLEVPGVTYTVRQVDDGPSTLEIIATE